MSTRRFATQSTVWVLTTFLVAIPCVAGSSGAARPDPDQRYWFVKLGDFDAEENLGFLEESKAAGSFLVGAGHRLRSKIWGEPEFGLASRDHEVTPGVLPAGTDDPTLSILWLSYSFIGRFPIGRVEPFLGLGVGIGYADLEDAPDVPFSPPDLEIADDTGVILHYRAGIDIGLRGRGYLGLEWRKIAFDADLGVFTDGTADIGGTAAYLTYKRTWGH